MFETISPLTIYAMIHILGVVLGAGGAFMHDISFFSSIRDKVLSATEIYLSEFSSKVMWVGIGLMAVSGALLFSRDVQGYLESPEFFAKATVAAIIFINGLIVHFMHLPRMRRVKDRPFSEDKAFVEHIPLIITSGGISIVSWVFIVLGVLYDAPYSYLTIISVYTSAVLIAITLGFVWKRISLGAST